MKPYLTVLLDGYAVLIHAAEEGGCWAETPDRPGCVAQGENLEEVLANIVEAREAVGAETWTE